MLIFVDTRGSSFSLNFLFICCRQRNQASPGEFPWMCLVLGVDPAKPKPNWDKIIAHCVIVPETFENDVSYGTNKVISITNRLRKVTMPE